MMAQLLYFVKYPEPGKVKTRLAKTVGGEAAAEIYAELAQKNFSRLLTLAPAAQTTVFFEPAAAEARVRDWLQGADAYVPQPQGDLGQRLKHAVSLAFEDVDRVILAGSDTLRLSADIVRDALHALEKFDAVLGPAHDGGYYLFGMNEPLQSVFDGIDWSTEHVLAQTKVRLDHLCLTYGELSPLEDLDEWPQENSMEEIYELIRI